MIPELSLTFRLLLAVFTCYRLSRLIARDDGPFFIFKRVRYWIKDKAWEEASLLGNIERTDKGEWVVEDRHFGKWYSLAEGLECPYCLGVWFSIPLLFMVLNPTFYGDVFLILMTISGVQAFLWGVVSK